MILTDNSLRPSERFIQVISEYLFKEGYTFKKSQKSFEKPFDKGHNVIQLWFRIGALTNVTFSWWLFFEKLAKTHANILGRPKSYKKLMYMPAGLAIHTRWEKNYEHTWNLYDENTLIYTDLSINKAAEKFIQAYELYVPSYFNHFKKYESLESDYNQDEFKSIAGILLAKYFDKLNINYLLEIFEKQIDIRENDSTSEEHKSFERLKEYLLHSDIKSLL
ncbi:hypothetical protein [Ferruginibacter sp.]